MLFKTVALLVLSTVALAHPKRNLHSHHHHHGTAGTGLSGFALPTGGAPSMNSTDSGFGGAFGAGSSSAVVSAITETVVPLAASTPAAPMQSPAASSPAEFFQDYSSSPVAAQTAPSTTSSCSSTSTSTYTSTQFVYMTVSGSQPAAAMSSSAAVTDDASSPVADFHAPTSTASTSTTSSLSVAAAGFYEKSSFSNPAFTAPTSAPPAVVPTTFATSIMASSVFSSAAPPSSSNAPATGGSTSGKKGLSYNTASLTDAFAGDGITWAYNWGSSPGGTILSGAEYVPMLWGLAQESGWAAAAAAAKSSGSTHALSFNEPDLSSQSNIDPATAASNHIKYMNPLSAQGMQIGSPAVTNGAGTSPLMGIDWLNAFFTACAGQCKIDFVAFHWYADASDTAYFEQHVSDVVASASAAGISKVWLTEFGVTGGDAVSFLNTVIPYLDSNAAVERYAYFMCGAGANQLLSGTSLNTIGDAYAA